jgi:RES domain
MGSLLNMQYDVDTLPKAFFVNQIAYRLIPSKFPPKSLFDDVANHDEFEILFAIQALTNPRIRNEMGSINRVPVGERPYGITGCNYALGPFVHLNPLGSRFSPNNYTAAQELGTTLKANGAQGIAYNSVRHSPFLCFALFTPNIISEVIQTAHYDYIWDGKKITVALESVALESVALENISTTTT